MPKVNFLPWPGNSWMPFTFQAALLALQQPHKHSHSLQLAIHTQLAHHYNMLYELFHFWTTSDAKIIVLAAGSSMGTWLLYSDSVRQSLEDEGLCLVFQLWPGWLAFFNGNLNTLLRLGSDEGLCLVLQLWPQWLAFRLTKSSLCFFFANLSSFLLSISSSLIPRSSFFCFLPSGFVWTQILGSDTYNYLQDVLWDLVHYPSFQANSTKCIHW